MNEKSELEIGIEVEKEHTKDHDLAAKIAQDHLKHDKHYYTKLKKAGLDEDDCEVEDEPTDAGIVAPVTPSVAVFKIDTPTDLSVAVAGDDQTKLASSGLGGSGVPKPLKTDKLTAPSEKNKVGPNKVVVGRTPTMGNSDPLDHFGGQMVEKW